MVLPPMDETDTAAGLGANGGEWVVAEIEELQRGVARLLCRGELLSTANHVF